jgi:hypothetical protein
MELCCFRSDCCSQFEHVTQTSVAADKDLEAEMAKVLFGDSYAPDSDEEPEYDGEEAPGGSVPAPPSLDELVSSILHFTQNTHRTRAHLTGSVCEIICRYRYRNA